jgi:hypothetical protein
VELNGKETHEITQLHYSRKKAKRCLRCSIQPAALVLKRRKMPDINIQCIMSRIEEKISLTSGYCY